jgi:Zn-dependent metalloprotease
MNDYVQTFADHGGVHINSGIPNHAFYLAATQIGGYAWEKAGRIWYETLLDPQLRPNANFMRFASLTLAHAEKLFGAGSLERKAVGQAWNAVGIAVS